MGRLFRQFKFPVRTQRGFYCLDSGAGHQAGRSVHLLQDHAGGIHKLLEELKQGRSADHDIFLQIAENTSYCKVLQDIFDLLASKDRDGWKTI